MARRTELSVDTRTEDLLALGTPKPFMLQLAQKVFNTTSGKVLHAFIQFDNQSLARIIDAKRAGVWDFGQHIVLMENGKGYTYPNKADALRMLGEAEEQVASSARSRAGLKYLANDHEDNEQPGMPDEPEQSEASPSPEESMSTIDQRRADLEALNKRPLQQCHLEVTGNRTAQGETKTAEGISNIINRILAVEFAEDCEPFDPRPTGPTVIVNTVLPDTDTDEPEVAALPVQSSSADIAAEMLQDQEEAPVVEDIPEPYTEEDPHPIGVETVTIDAGQVMDKLQRLLMGLRGTFALVDVIQRRQAVLADEILTNGVMHPKWPRVPDGIVQDFDFLVNDELGGLDRQEPENGRPKDVVLEEDLRSMSLPQLQNYAESIGIPDAHAQAMYPILLRQVLHHQKLQAQ